MSNFEIEGMEELLSKLSKVESSVLQNTDNILTDAGNNVKEEMKRLVKVSDVNHIHIRDDIEVSKIKLQGTNKYVEIAPGKKTNWRAKFLEFGTVKMDAQPFMEPAHLNTKRENMELIKRRIMEVLRI